MARIRSDVVVAASVAETWLLVTDWAAQSRWIPLTTVTVDHLPPAGPGVGTRFTGRSRLGPVAFDDPMEVTDWQPPAGAGPGRCRIRKLGPWLTGWAEITVRAADGAAHVEWIEEVRPRWTPRFADPVVAAVGSLFFGRVLRAMAAEVAPPQPR
jgi:hypothetical protein